MCPLCFLRGVDHELSNGGCRDLLAGQQTSEHVLDCANIQGLQFRSMSIVIDRSKVHRLSGKSELCFFDRVKNRR